MLRAAKNPFPVIFMFLFCHFYQFKRWPCSRLIILNLLIPFIADFSFFSDFGFFFYFGFVSASLSMPDCPFECDCWVIFLILFSMDNLFVKAGVVRHVCDFVISIFEKLCSSRCMIDITSLRVISATSSVINVCCSFSI